MMPKILLVATLITTISIMLIPSDVSAHPHVTVTPLSAELSLQETVMTMNVPSQNTLPWGVIRGESSETAERYPVIIQVYQGEDLVHVAQVDVKGDGSYEYKFRVRNLDSDTGKFVNIFSGDYTVKVYRVIPNASMAV